MSDKYLLVLEGIRKELKSIRDELYLMREAVERGVDTDPLTMVAEAMKNLGSLATEDVQIVGGELDSDTADDPLADVPASERYRFAPID